MKTFRVRLAAFLVLAGLSSVAAADEVLIIRPGENSEMRFIHDQYGNWAVWAQGWTNPEPLRRVPDSGNYPIVLETADPEHYSYSRHVLFVLSNNGQLKGPGKVMSNYYKTPDSPWVTQHGVWKTD